MIKNVNISGSFCSKSQNRTYFAYPDYQHNGVIVYDFITQNYYRVSPYDCLDCPQLILLGDQYLIVRDTDHDFVLDTKTNFSLIINTSGGFSDILAVLHSNITIHNVVTPSPSTIDIHNTTKTKFPQVPSINITVTPTIISTPNHTYAITPSPLVTVHSIVTTATGTYYYKYSLHDYYYFMASHICTHSRPSCSQSPTQ